jgi:hypothetical protein
MNMNAGSGRPTKKKRVSFQIGVYQKYSGTGILFDALVVGRPESHGVGGVRDPVPLSQHNASSKEWPPNVMSYFDEFKNGTGGRSLALSKSGCLILASLDICPGDSILILFGCSVPIISRKEPDGSYKWVTDGYMYGVMDGDAMDDLKDGKYVAEEIMF